MGRKTHHIEIGKLDEDRSYWDCDCGCAGSAPTENVEIAAERHVEDDEHITYQYRG